MVYFKLKNVSINFPIYNAINRSMRSHLANFIGGKVGSMGNKLYVQGLDNINLEINDNERVGLIGHNGAGKTTMLKLLSGIYEPISGTIESEGRISSLTDITMGMDSENTGYQNIITKCIFMGMTFRQARSKAQEIIDFSELADYIDLPIRTYSTGMSLRLAFSVATCVTPDILIMDEMISAGDASFIDKAHKRAIEMVADTRIMILSSHDLGMLSKVCTRGIWLEKGQIRSDGPIDQVIKDYRKFVGQKSE